MYENFPHNITERVHTSTERDREGWRNLLHAVPGSLHDLAFVSSDCLSGYALNQRALGIGQAVLRLQVATN